MYRYSSFDFQTVLWIFNFLLFRKYCFWIRCLKCDGTYQKSSKIISTVPVPNNYIKALLKKYICKANNTFKNTSTVPVEE
jgi:hypothetical protein